MIKQMTKIAILVLIGGCATQQAPAPAPIAEPLVDTWELPSAKQCDLILSGDIQSLPVDLVVSVNRSDLGRYDALNSFRPWMINSNLETKEFGSHLIDKTKEGQVYFSLANWHPTKNAFYVNQTWEDPQHAMREEAKGELILDSQKYRSDVLEIDLDTMDAKNLTQDPEVSYYNAGAVAVGSKILFSAIINGNAKTYSMNQDGSDKRPAIQTQGFVYGLSYSPDRTKYAFHSANNGYKVFIGDVTTGIETQVQTPCAFNFGPKWSPDSQRIVFKCGSNANTPDLYVADRNGQNAQMLASLGGYNSAVAFMDGHDHHGGGSDRIEWTQDSQGVVHGKKIGSSIELVISKLNGTHMRLTHTDNTHHSFPQVSKDGQWLVFNSKVGSNGTNLMIQNLQTLEITQVTDMEKGCNTRMGFWKN